MKQITDIRQDATLAVRVDRKLAEQFKQACKDNRKTHAEVLRAMMVAYVHKSLGS